MILDGGNLPPLAARIPDLAEVAIGHGLTADASRTGHRRSFGRAFREALRGQVAWPRSWLIGLVNP